MKTYRLTLRRTFTAADDIEARGMVRNLLDNPQNLVRAEREVHEVYENKAPRTVLLHKRENE